MECQNWIFQALNQWTLAIYLYRKIHVPMVDYKYRLKIFVPLAHQHLKLKICSKIHSGYQSKFLEHCPIDWFQKQNSKFHHFLPSGWSTTENNITLRYFSQNLKSMACTMLAVKFFYYQFEAVV